MPSRAFRATLLFFLVATVFPQAASPYAVSTSSPWATEAALDVLRQGGNATDAMVAASFVLNVTQPYKMGIGGGGFYLASRGGKVWYWDHREMAPASAHEKMFLLPNGDEIPYWPDRVTGPNPVGVPGTPAGLFEAHRALGRLPWKRLLEPAVRLARQGFPITQRFEEELEENWERMSRFPATAAIFGDATGKHMKRGRVLRQPLLGETIDTIARKGAPEFYTGALARSWQAEAGKLGVRITLDDLKTYKVRKAEPIRFRVFGLEGVTAPPPSAAGLMVAATLRYLESYYRTREVKAPDSAARVIVSAEAMAYFQERRNKGIGDPATGKSRPEGYLDPAKFLGSAEEKAAWAEIDRRVAARLEKIETKVTQSALPERDGGAVRGVNAQARVPHHTAHLSIADDAGMAVSYTTTIEALFGSGITVTKHGFLLNNELSDFSAKPGSPNSAAPFKRPRSNMSPTILFDRGAAVAVVGCAGGQLIPTAVVELLENFYLHQMTAREAIAFPRFHPSPDSEIEVESSMPESTVARLRAAGYTVSVVPRVWAVAEALMRRSPRLGWEAAAEPRYDGLGISITK